MKKLKFKELNTGYEGEKTVRERKPMTPRRRAVFIIVATLVLAFLIVFLLSRFGIVPLGSLAARAGAVLSGDEKRFPLGINTDSTLDVDKIGSNLLVLTTDNYTVYSEKGRELFSSPHTFARPAVCVSGDRAVIYDRGGTGYKLITASKELYSGDASGTILAAAHGKKGNYALATRANGATSRLDVYNRNHGVVFSYQSAEEYITSVTLSDDGKFAGIAAFGAKNGDLYTVVTYFGFAYKEPLNRQVFNGVSPLKIDFTSDTSLTLFTEKGIYRVRKSAKKNDTVATFYQSEFSSYSENEKGRYAVVLAKYGSSDKYEILLYNGYGKKVDSFSCDEPVRSVALSKKYVFALTQEHILVYNFHGGLVSKIALSGEAYEIYPTDDYVFVTSLDRIARCYSYGDSSISLTGKE